ncbi:MAG: ferritin-like domain-containing protein [Candidatus Dormibacteria bacterium]
MAISRDGPAGPSGAAEGIQPHAEPSRGPNSHDLRGPASERRAGPLSSQRRQFLRDAIVTAGTLAAGVTADIIGVATTAPGITSVIRDATTMAARVTSDVIGASTTAQTSPGADVQMLQTAASLENLAVAVYTNPTAQQLIAAIGNHVLVGFVTKTVEQHTDHAKAFNAAAVALGGGQQMNLDRAVFDTVVSPALARISGPVGIIQLALTLEDAAAQTYVRFAGEVGDGRALQPLAAIAAVEAEHTGVLRILQVLLEAGVSGATATLLPDLASIPGGAVSEAVVVAASPRSFYPTDAARPAGEGAVG